MVSVPLNYQTWRNIKTIWKRDSHLIMLAFDCSLNLNLNPTLSGCEGKEGFGHVLLVANKEEQNTTSLSCVPVQDLSDHAAVPFQVINLHSGSILKPLKILM